MVGASGVMMWLAVRGHTLQCAVVVVIVRRHDLVPVARMPAKDVRVRVVGDQVAVGQVPDAEVRGPLVASLKVVVFCVVVGVRGSAELVGLVVLANNELDSERIGRAT